MSPNPATSPQRSRRRRPQDDAARETLLAEVATLYFQDRLNQEEIAHRLGRSIATVSRLLAKAKARDIVEVHVQSAVPVVPALQAALVARFGLRVARVAHVSADEPQTLLPSVGHLTARYISTIVGDGDVICVTGGATMREVVRAIAPAQYRDLHVVQAMGSLGSRVPTMDNPLMTQVIAERLGGSRHLLPAPLIVESPAVRDALAQDPHFHQTLQYCQRADIALAGIGGMEPSQSAICRAGYLEAWEMERLRGQGAVGDMMVEFFDLSGRILATEFGGQIMGMRQRDLRTAGTVIATAAGEAKAPAILGALRTGLIHVLVTDSVTARRILELADTSPSDTQAGGRTLGGAPVAPAAAPRRARPEGSLRGDIAEILAAIAASSAQGQGPSTPGMDRAMLGQAFLDKEPFPTPRACHEQLRQRLAQTLAEGKARGELDDRVDVGILIDAMLGALGYRLSFAERPLDAAYLQNLVATLLVCQPAGKAGPPDRRSGGPPD